MMVIISSLVDQGIGGAFRTGGGKGGSHYSRPQCCGLPIFAVYRKQ